MHYLIYKKFGYSMYIYYLNNINKITMKFTIGFNRLDAKETAQFYSHIEANREYHEDIGTYYTVTLNSMESLERLMEKVNLYLAGDTYTYSAVISFDPSTIYLDNQV